ncbi:MAG: ribbon-helix-helix protein, CopG family [Chloroflexi bacterium]|nr:ribbon-helix-helix protein, CopG family [Chloroflexota bacterium]
MPKKIIQVPIDEELLKELNTLSKKQHKARAEVIREACAHYIAEAEEEELDRIYAEGYRRIPDDPELGEALDKLAAEVLSEESW